jgi:hypothetical protein
MKCYSISSARTRRLFTRFNLTAAALFCLSAAVHAQGLVYVDARDQGYGYPYANIYTSAGAEIPYTSNNGILDPLTGGPGAADGQWHWRSNPQFGVPSDGYNTIYASESEDVPEIRMVLRGADGLAPATNYDVYVVYWADRAANWNIRAGLTSGALTLFDRTGSVPNTATAGTFASAAAWNTPPADSLNAGTGLQSPGANDPGDDNTSPFVSHTPGSPENSTRDMYLGFLGSAQLTTQTIGGASASVVSVFLNDLPQTANANERTWFDGLAFVPAGTTVFLTASLDRDTGVVTVNNPTGTAFNVASYSITSAAGSLDATQWNTFTNNTATIDDTDPWQITAPASPGSTVSTTVLTEAETPANNGVVFPGPAGTLNLGDIWRRTPYEDVQVALTLTSGAVVTIAPDYEGDEITAGDFTGAMGTPDGEIDHLDYLALIDGLHVNHATRALAYARGDINLSGTVDRTDVLTFRNVFNQENGAGSFDRMLYRLSVPEPSALLLGILACSPAVLVRRRRAASSETAPIADSEAPSVMHRRRSTAWMVMIVAAGALAGGWLAGPARAQVPVINWTHDPITTPAGVLCTNCNTNSPTFGGGDDALSNAHMWANMPSAVSLDNGKELVLSGRMNLTGIDLQEAGGFRWGFFYDGFPYANWATLDPPPTAPAPPATRDQPTIGWLGYIANSSAGGPNGRLEAKNPDKNNFFTRSSISTFGGERAFKAGPCANAQTPDPDGCGASVFYLAEATGQNLPMPDGNYEFQFILGRYGEEVDVTAVLQSLDPGNNYNLILGGGLDYEGRFPAGNDAMGNPVVPRPHVTFEFNRVSLFFASSNLRADQAVMQDILIAERPVESLTLEIDLANNGAARFINNSDEDFDMIYYDIVSDSGSLNRNSWDPFDPTPNAATDGVGWNVSGSYNDPSVCNATSCSVLSEVNLSAGGAQDGDFNLDGVVDVADSVMAEKNGEDYETWAANFGESGTSEEGAQEFLADGDPVSLGNIFDTSGEEDLRFFFIQSDGSTVRGIVDYINGGQGGAVPEPSTLAMCLLAGIAAFRRRR